MAIFSKIWDEDKVLKYIVDCLEYDKGTPVFTKYLPGGAELPKGHILLMCRDWDDNDLLDTWWLVGVPEDVEKIAKQKYEDKNRPKWLKIMLEILKDKLKKKEIIIR